MRTATATKEDLMTDLSPLRRAIAESKKAMSEFDSAAFACRTAAVLHGHDSANYRAARRALTVAEEQMRLADALVRYLVATGEVA